MKFIDRFLNTITMYRLVLYVLIGLVGLGGLLSLVGLLHFNFIAYCLSVFIMLAACWITNKVFANVFDVPTNIESVYITALILALIISPFTSVSDIFFLFWAGVLAMASKFILAMHKKHIFNPAAIAIVITAYAANQSASWWVGTGIMLPFVLVGGLLIVRKIQREDLVFSFFVAAAAVILGNSILNHLDMLATLQKTLVDSPILFFAFIMLTEPLTTPPTKKLQIIYGALVGVLFAPQVHIGSWYTTPEVALVIGNIYAFIVSPKDKLILHLKEQKQVAQDTIDFIFAPHKKLAFAPGQYMEWTLAHKNADDRGNRRYFTLASSPTEADIILGVRFSKDGSSYKKKLQNLSPNDRIIAAQLAGDFTLPKDPTQKLVFIAGGIGVTPFRSMIKYLIDKNEKRDAVLFYSNRNVTDIAYKDIFDQAQQTLGIKTIYTLTDKSAVPANWTGEIGYIDAAMVKKYVPDYTKRHYYISGPNSMVENFSQILQNMGVHKRQIITDFFPGFA